MFKDFIQKSNSRKFMGAVAITVLSSFFLWFDKIDGEIWAWLIWGSFTTYSGLNAWSPDKLAALKRPQNTTAPKESEGG